MEELITEVDKNDNVLGSRPKSEFRNSNHIHRSSHLYVFNSKNELLIQKRAKCKEVYPDLYDASVSGTVSKDETYEETLEREMQEELGIQVPYEKLFKYSCFDDIDKAIKVVFKAKFNGPFKTDPKEVGSIHWMSLDKIKELIKTNPELFCKPFLEAIKIYLRNI
jgi:isopentenyl-diphosphate Delta-isomerase